ncbi:hypothetical protein RLOC_00009421 [Lonchura striata]|uniref:Uncharacterized protein n=1 Tax=Lonchura striata TaxID=40157 RepID=A0A218UHH3_9PASE|nr:hypothetical protein RLOC_00009421 [Lonchura striata domestica]
MLAAKAIHSEYAKPPSPTGWWTRFPVLILLKLRTKPYPYTDKAADLVREASVLQVATGLGSNISIPVSHIDGADDVDYLDAVFTGLLHSPREPLAPCVTFQLCDKAAKYPQLYQFNQYYRLWMPKQSQEPVVWNP